MKLGIVGLPNVGKSSLFNALTGAGAPSENYPFCTIDPNVGVVAVPDPRMDPEAMEEKLEAGPFATVHIQKGGRPAMDPMVLLQGFALEFVSCLLLVVLLSLAQIRWYTNRLLFASLVGLLIAIYAQGGLVIWWHQDLGWHARTIIHDVVAWFAAGAVIAGFAKPSN